MCCVINKGSVKEKGRKKASPTDSVKQIRETVKSRNVEPNV